ncbi:MAG: YhjD/YihY/BrkB family envelope integrity protein, partial [Phenylobacterium sp.]|nr:YhjD/YihY/BrkB family envelope integrity protein [Phenylobacterium sp.]
MITFRPMSIRGQIQRLRDIDWDPLHWVRRTLSVNGKALTRLWGRDVMLYVGGVSFFVLLAVFPGLAIMVGVYSFFADASQAAAQAEMLSHLMPPVARGLFEGELTRLARAPLEAVSAQSGVALIIGSYASHRGFKALLAGLSFIHDDEAPRGFVGFNVMALLVLVASLLLVGMVSVLFLGLRVAAVAWNLKPLAGLSWLYSEWT